MVTNDDDVGREECKKVISEVLVSGGQVDNLIFCDFLNISFCRFTETNSKVKIFSKFFRDFISIFFISLL